MSNCIAVRHWPKWSVRWRLWRTFSVEGRNCRCSSAGTSGGSGNRPAQMPRATAAPARQPPLPASTTVGPVVQLIRLRSRTRFELKSGLQDTASKISCILAMDTADFTSDYILLDTASFDTDSSLRKQCTRSCYIIWLNLNFRLHCSRGS